MDSQNNHFQQQITAFTEAIRKKFEQDNSNSDCEYIYILIKFLIDFISESSESTIQGLTQNLHHYANNLINRVQTNGYLESKTFLVFKSSCEIFFAFLNKNYPKETNIEMIKKKLKELGMEFLDYISQTTNMMMNSSKRIIKDGSTFMIHGHSLLIENILIKMAAKSIRFSVIIPECRPSCEGYDMCNRLAKHNIPTTLITDSAISIYIDEADFVLSGAEAVVENGGIINGIGTYTLALIAFSKKKPFFVMSESFKFSRIFPLSQKDLTKELPKKEQAFTTSKTVHPNVKINDPLADYTPPNLIDILITDRGIFTPSAVNDTLIQMFGK